MSALRIETQNGVHHVCGGILPASFVQVGQTWMSSCGGQVRVDSVDGGWVGYSWTDADGGKRSKNEKDNFSFQCRYCLVVEVPEVPAELVELMREAAEASSSIENQGD